MKRILILLLALMLVFSLCSCDTNEHSGYDEDEDFSDTRTDEDEPSGDDESLLNEKDPVTGEDDTDNQPIVSDKENETRKVSLELMTATGLIGYDNIQLSPSGPYYTDSDGDLLLPFSYNSAWGFANQNGDPLIEDVEGTYPRNFSEGFAFVKNHVYNEAGALCYSLPEGVSGTFFKDGYAVMVEQGTLDPAPIIHILDKNMEYRSVEIKLPDGLVAQDYTYKPLNVGGFRGAIGFCGNDDGITRIAVVDSKSNLVALYDAKKAFSAAKAAFSYASFGTSMSTATAMSVDTSDLTKMLSINDGYIAVMNDEDKWGLMDLQTGDMVIDYAYDYVGACSEGVVPVCRYGTWGVVDLNGNELIPCRSFRYIGAFVNERAIAINHDEDICVINTAGEEIGVYDVNVSSTTLSGTTKGFLHTAFTKDTHIAVIYKYEKAYIVSDTGRVLHRADTASYRSKVEQCLYMNNDYIAVWEKDGVDVYKIIYQ